jgi:NADPH-dependent glutamate synthase beta subunit-like oxidoreductase/NAD-dependent dihydropyrimidine dehydrogenase PreA subunit
MSASPSRLSATAVPDARWFADTVSCRAACPVGTNAAGYVVALSEGRVADAYDLAREHNPFPSVCGRVCSAPCERACRRGVVDQPIAIRALKRHLAEAHGVEAGDASRWHRAHGAVPPATRPSVGIIGAGPAGLAAACELRLAGHAVTLYERDQRPGGMLVFGIPAFRLPREVVEGEVEAILSLGVTLERGVRVGVDVTLDTLLGRHAAVLVAVGCARGRSLSIEGATLPGVMRAVEALRRINAGEDAGLAAPVVVIGGGSVAFDAARTARRTVGGLGDAEAAYDGQTALDAARAARRSSRFPVTLIAPEPLAQLPVPAEELEEAEREGVVIRAASAVRRIEGEGSVQRVVVAPVLSLVDAAGRFAPQLAEGRDEVLPAGTVILAVGQESDTRFVDDAVGVARARWGGLVASRDGRTSHPRLYAAGDVASGPRDLIDAVAFGQRAARAIRADLAAGAAPADRTGRPASPSPGAAPSATPAFDRLPRQQRFWSGYDALPRTELPVLPAGARTMAREVEAGLTREEAVREASRCLHCHEHVLLEAARCIACGGCVDVCPYGCIALEPIAPAQADAWGDDAATRDAAGRPFALTLDERACIRCGLCVARCPTGALSIGRERVTLAAGALA